jgi:hypothetical protein
MVKGFCTSRVKQEPKTNKIISGVPVLVTDPHGTVAKPPPYIDRMMQKAPTYKSLLPICAKNGAGA